eukprot:gene8524-11521_t
MSLASVLQNAQSPNLAVRTQAETYLNQAVEAQYGPFLLALCVELATEGNDESNRVLAGIYIKNLISSKDQVVLQHKINQWVTCDPDVKERIRTGFLQGLLSPVKSVGRTAAQILAAYGSVDVPNNSWPTLLPSIFHNITSADVSDLGKIASLEALGYMCDTMDPAKVEDSVVNQILSSIIDGMRSDRRNEVRYAAITALNNSLAFTSTNFENDVERNMIMQAICEATQCTDIKVRAEAYSCLATIADLYYDKLGAYVDTLFQLSTTAIKTDEAEVGIHAIEFWSTICESEHGKIVDLEDGASAEDVGVFLRIIEQASKQIVPLMLDCMTKQDEDDEENEWNISSAAAVCIEGISKVTTDGVVDLVLPFITQNINNPNWRLKDAAVAAFGTILDGPSDEKLKPLVFQAMPILINCLKDSSKLVRETSAWTIGRICELHKSALSPEILPPMVTGLASALDDPSAKVASQACYAVHNLADACSAESDEPSNVLSHFMPHMLQKLLNVSTRDDPDDENIGTTAYETINRMVENSAQDMQSIVLQLLTESLNRLEATFNPQFTSTKRSTTQSSLCILIGEISKKLDPNDLAPFSDRIMQLLFQVFGAASAIAHEDAYMAIGFFAEKMEGNFLRYMTFLQPLLVAGLKNIEEHQVCTVSVGLVGDLCRALSSAILPFCDEIMRCLLELLQSVTLNRAVKPHVIAVFSDIAMAIEGDFERYVAVILGILKQAGEVNIDTDDEDLIEYINLLRSSILDAYTGIIQGLKSSNKQDLVLPAIDNIVEFLNRSASDDNRTEDVLKASVGLIGDLGQTYGARMKVIFSQSFIAALIQEGLGMEDDIKQTAAWAQQVVNAVRANRVI